MDRLRTIEVFVRVAELGGFTRAARALGMPRASVTAAIQDLEARLQAKLLHRTTRTTALTTDGALYLDEARRILRELDDLEAGLHGAIRSPRGRLRVDVPASAGRNLLAPRLPEFLARYPDLEVELGIGDRPVDLIAEGVDCVIRGGDVHDDTLVGRRLGVLPVITCASPGYLAARGVPTDLADLADHLHVGFTSPRTRRIFALEFERDGEVETALPRQRLAVNDADAWIAAAVAGLGLLQAPLGQNVRGHLRRGELVRVLAAWPVPPLPVTVAWPRERQVAARVRAFVDWVVEVYAVECREAAEVEFISRC